MLWCISLSRCFDDSVKDNGAIGKQKWSQGCRACSDGVRRRDAGKKSCLSILNRCWDWREGLEVENGLGWFSFASGECLLEVVSATRRRIWLVT